MTTESTCRKCKAPLGPWLVFPLCDTCFTILDDYVREEAAKAPDGKCPTTPRLLELMGLKEPDDEKVWN